jgi:hypothetical protein
MTYLANTGITGTNLHSLANALSVKMPEKGGTGRVERTTYEVCLERGEPFIASVKLPHIRWHAIYVERLTPDFATVVDPLEGWHKSVPRAQFEKEWDRTIVWVER